MTVARLLIVFWLVFASPSGGANTVDKPAKTVLVAVDLSSSTAPHRKDYLKYFRTILDTMGEGDKLLVVKISERPATGESLAIPAIEYETGSVLKNSHKIKAINLTHSLGALKAFEKLLATHVDETPILEVTQGIPRLLSLYKSERLVMVYLSDMMEYSRTTANFESTKPVFNRKAAEDAFSKLKRDGRIASLQGVTIYVAGARELESDKHNAVVAAARREAVKWFWASYFSASGAKLGENAYAADLLQFDALECNTPNDACRNGVFTQERDKRLTK